MAEFADERNTNSTLTLEDLDSFGNLNLQTGFDFDKEVSLGNIQEIDRFYEAHSNHDFDLEMDQSGDLDGRVELGNEDLDQLDLDQLDLNYDNNFEQDELKNELDHLGLDRTQDPLNQSEIDQLEGMTRLTMPDDLQSPLNMDELKHHYQMNDENNENNGSFLNSVNGRSSNHSARYKNYESTANLNEFQELQNNGGYNHSPIPTKTEELTKSHDVNLHYHEDINSLQEQIEALKTQLLHSERDKQVQILQLRKDLLGEKERVLLDFTKQVQDHQNNLESQLREAKDYIKKLEEEKIEVESRTNGLETEKSQRLVEIEALKNCIEDLKASNVRLSDKLEAQCAEMQNRTSSPIAGFAFEELQILLDPVITIPEPLSADSIREGIEILTGHIQNQSDRLKQYKSLEKEWNSRKMELEHENDRLRNEPKISRDDMVSHTQKLKNQFNKVYQKSLQDFKSACLEKHKAVVVELKTRIRDIESRNASSQTQLKQKYLVSLKKMQADFQKQRENPEKLSRMIDEIKTHILTYHSSCKCVHLF